MISGKSASVHDRLLALARKEKSDFNLILTKYGLERLLFRLSMSPYKDRFLLKGALLFSLWFDEPKRPTRDADLLGLDPLGVDQMEETFRAICNIEDADGMLYLGDSVKAVEIREDSHYGGIRVELIGKLGNARLSLQIDVGYGDAVTPEPVPVYFPTLLSDCGQPSLRAYPRETVIAEKLEAMVVLGMANSRMKDYFDLFILFGESSFNPDLAALAIAHTFARRKTALPHTLPLGLSEDFASDEIKNTQWNAFLKKNHLMAPSLYEVVSVIRVATMKLIEKALHSVG
jgi:hypothetical protein